MELRWVVDPLSGPEIANVLKVGFGSRGMSKNPTIAGPQPCNFIMKERQRTTVGIPGLATDNRVVELAIQRLVLIDQSKVDARPYGDASIMEMHIRDLVESVTISAIDILLN